MHTKHIKEKGKRHTAVGGITASNKQINLFFGHI